jgi:Fe-S cluster biogenesis protein NfuA
MTDQAVNVSLEFTPNPNTLKFVVNRTLLETGAANFTSADKTETSPLAKKLFSVGGVTGVMIGRNFVTVSKGETGDWELIHQNVMDTVTRHLEAGEPAVLKTEGTSAGAPTAHTSATGEIETKIRQILDEEIRPAVAMDGGDITFDKYLDGVVYLFLQGACSGCPSSTMTLKINIESRLRKAIPEIKEVVSI